ncbi:ABC transporter substrate-binding protein [Saccharospirillum alexandrii]|uniref:ABC transporter substrate-binding protein n=1 Tax=Saccharospirillum alexandrii TaxID=2448477 RepID=UPI000FDC1FFF|nr:extracellular solute-binding protein [Saccharospirillum alexandrii]
MKKATITTLVGATLTLFAGSAIAECNISSGSVRILGNDFDSIRTVTDQASACASSGTTVRVNLTTEHKNIQVPALTITPAEYTVALIANNSISPLLSADLVRPLNDLVEKYGQDLLPNQLIRTGDDIVAIAFMGNAQHLFMRGDILDDLGVEPPATYEEIIDVAEMIRSEGIMEYPLAATYEAGWYLAAEFVNMHLGMGGQFFEAGSAQPALNNEAGVRTLEMMKTLTEYMSPEYLTVTADEMKQMYLAGEVAIMNQWGSMVAGHLGEDSGNQQISEATILAPAPTAHGNNTPAAALWWDGFTIAKNISDEDAEASFQAMMYGIRPDMAQQNPNAATWLIKDFDAPDTAQGVLQTARLGARGYPMSPFMGYMHAALGTELSDFMQGRESAEQALMDVEASYLASVREAGLAN